MVYFSNGQITIRNMECIDAQAISLVAEYSGKPVGYINMVLVKKRVGKYSIIYTASKLCVAMSFTV